MRNSVLAAAAVVLVGCGGGSAPDQPPEPVEVPEAVEVPSPAPRAAPVKVASAPAKGPEWVGGPGTLTVAYSNNVDGEIEPCG